jgi:hypothetical protein
MGGALHGAIVRRGVAGGNPLTRVVSVRVETECEPLQGPRA